MRVPLGEEGDAESTRMVSEDDATSLEHSRSVRFEPNDGHGGAASGKRCGDRAVVGLAHGWSDARAQRVQAPGVGAAQVGFR